MHRDHTDHELGRRDFLRSAALLGTGVGLSTMAGACSERGEELPTTTSHDLVSGRKWIRVDSTDTATGISMSLDGFSDTIENVFSSNVGLSGHAVLASGEIVPLTLTVEKDIANSISLNSLGGGLYRMEVGGAPHPFGAPYEIRLMERTIPGTSVIILAGYSVDPSTGNRVIFNVTHDPIPWLDVVIGAGIVGLSPITVDGKKCNVKGGVSSVSVNVGGASPGGGGANSLAVSATTGSSGLTATCTTKCNHDQGGGG